MGNIFFSPPDNNTSATKTVIHSFVEYGLFWDASRNYLTILSTKSKWLYFSAEDSSYQQISISPPRRVSLNSQYSECWWRFFMWHLFFSHGTQGEPIDISWFCLCLVGSTNDLFEARLVTLNSDNDYSQDWAYSYTKPLHFPRSPRSGKLFSLHHRYLHWNFALSVAGRHWNWGRRLPICESAAIIMTRFFWCGVFSYTIRI